MSEKVIETDIQWCESHVSVDVDGYCEAFHANAETGRWDPKDYDDVIARRFGKCHIVSATVVVEPIDR